MPFRFGLRRSKASQRAGQRPRSEPGPSKGQGSLVDGPKDELCESNVGGVTTHGAAATVLQPATAHGAAPVGVMESKPSLLKKTLSTLSLRKSQRAEGESAGRAGTPANGNHSGEFADGAKQPESQVATEAENAKKGAIRHGILPIFHVPVHQHANGVGGQEGATQAQSSQLPIHLPHLHLPHILETKPHQPAAHHDVLSGVENPDEVMKILEDATEHAKKIIETARGERETLLGRARSEAEEEINTLRKSLENQDQRVIDDAALEEYIRVLSTGEEKHMRELLELAQENMAASVTLCVDLVLNVDTSLVPERRDALRNLKNNPPSFYRKSQAHNYPSVRNSSAARPLGSKQSFAFADHSWDLDPREFTPDGSATQKPKSTVYAAILGERTYSADEDEFQIDFDELDRPSSMKRLGTAIKSSCGCFL